jgi:TP901 family phage tail tape measure protein
MAFDAGAVKARVLLDNSQYKKSAKETESATKKLGSAFAKLAMAGIAAVSAALAISVVKAHQFAKAFANVTTLVDMAVVNTNKMKIELLGLDARLGSAKDLTEGLYQALSASVEPAKAVEFVGQAAKFAKAALTDTNTAVDAITTALNAYGLEATQAGRVSDVFFQIVKRGKVTGQQLASTIGSVIPTAAALGVQVEEVGAALATMTKQGINSSVATTQLTQLMSAFIKPSSQMIDSLQKFGFESGSALIEAEGLSGALKFLEDASGGNIEKLGELIPNVRAMKGALALTGTSAKVFQEDLVAMNNSLGVTNEAFEKQETTLDAVKNQFGKIAIAIGTGLLPFLDRLGKRFLEATKDLDFSKIVTKIIDAVTAIDKAIFQFMIIPLRRIVDFFTLDLPRAWKTFKRTIEITGEGIKTSLEAILDPSKTVVQATQETAKKLKFLWLDHTQDVQKFANQREADFNRALTAMEERSAEFKKQLIGDTTTAVEESISLYEKLAERFKSKYANRAIVIQESLASKMQKSWDNIGKGIVSKMEFVLGQISNIMNGIFSIVNKSLQNELAVLENKHAIELEELEAQKEEKLLMFEEEKTREMETLQLQRDNDIISQEEFDIQSKELEEKKALEKIALEKKLTQNIENQKQRARDKENAKRKKAFEAQKGMEIANVWIQFAVGTIAAWAQSIAQLGPIAGSIMAAVLTAAMLGLAIGQTALISQQQFIPAREKGGAAGGLTRINESGGEIINLPDGSIVVPNDISRAIARNTNNFGGGMMVNVSFAGANISDDMSLRKISDFVIKDMAKKLRLKA